MKLFRCQNCTKMVHFDSTTCVNCGYRLGYLPESFTVSALVDNGGTWTALADQSRGYFLCDNAQYDACNWLVPVGCGETKCLACRHNHVVPDLTMADNLAHWRKLEIAKHYLFYSLMRWNLPMPNRLEDPEHGLTFDFRAAAAEPEHKVLTGHDEGLITINLAEADDGIREQLRTSMHEPYRTLIGHFRHEIGHYYWDLLVRDTAFVDRVRAVFGDDREDYDEALKRHYETGAPANWQTAFISSYATMHPWEDFAETWAHYIHMVDALETVHSFGITIQPPNGSMDDLSTSVAFDPYAADSAQSLVRAWVPVTIAINSVNRSVGQPDLYPFVLSSPVLDKLQLIHEIIHAHDAITTAVQLQPQETETA